MSFEHASDAGNSPAMDAGGQTDCTEALVRAFEFLDGEMGPTDVVRIQQHLDECGPCLRQYNLDTALKALVKRACPEQAPAELRTSIIRRISIQVAGLRRWACDRG